MGYFRELPDIYYPSPLSNKISSGDLIVVKNIFRRGKLYDYLSEMQLFLTNILLKMAIDQILSLNTYMDLQDMILL